MTSGILIGAIERRGGRIRLAEAGPVADATAGRFSGHQDMLRHGIISAVDSLGFSLEIASRQVRNFYRTSVLNREYEDFAIPNDMMLQVLAVIGLPRTADFRTYP